MQTPATYPLPSHPSGRHRVRDAVLRGILLGRYAGGTRLRQMELARRHGVAQSVVREGLLELQFCGLVRSVDRLGVFVSDLGPRLLQQAYEIREVLEGLAARLCCQTVGRGDLRSLEQTADRIHALGRSGRRREMGELDRSFHDALFRLSANELLLRLTDGYRFLGMVVQANRDIAQVHREHRAIVRAIGANRPDQAEAAAGDHVRRTRQAIERQLAQGRLRMRWVEASNGHGNGSALTGPSKERRP